MPHFTVANYGHEFCFLESRNYEIYHIYFAILFWVDSLHSLYPLE